MLRMETIRDNEALALIPLGRPSDDLKPVVEMIASWSEPFSQRALLIGVSGCHANLLLGSGSDRMSCQISSLGPDEIRKRPSGFGRDRRLGGSGTHRGRGHGCRSV